MFFNCAYRETKIIQSWLECRNLIKQESANCFRHSKNKSKTKLTVKLWQLKEIWWRKRDGEVLVTLNLTSVSSWPSSSSNGLKALVFLVRAPVSARLRYSSVVLSERAWHCYTWSVTESFWSVLFPYQQQTLQLYLEGFSASALLLKFELFGL